MLGFRINSPGPFWFEDLCYFVIDEGRRLPGRTLAAAARIRRLAETAAETAAQFDPTTIVGARPWRSPAKPAAVPLRQTSRMDEPEVWSLATEPLIAVGVGTNRAIALHNSATEQLDALTYVLDGLREELRPLMTYARLDDQTVVALPDEAALETSIEALLELSRKNAATRPKDRIRTAA